MANLRSISRSLITVDPFDMLGLLDEVSHINEIQVDKCLLIAIHYGIDVSGLVELKGFLIFAV